MHQQDEEDSIMVELEQEKATQEDPSSSPRSVSRSPSKEKETITLQEDSIPLPPLLSSPLAVNFSLPEEEQKTANEQQQEEAATTKAIVSVLLEDVVAAVAAKVEQETKQQEEEDEIIREEEILLRKLLSNGLQQISYKERCMIEDEIHGVQSIGLMEDEDEVVVADNEAPPEGKEKKEQATATLTTTTADVTTMKKKQNCVRTKLQEFNKHLDLTLLRLSPHTDLYKSFFSEEGQEQTQIQQDPVLGDEVQDQVAEGAGVSSNIDAVAAAVVDGLSLSVPSISTRAYELCQRKDYMYAAQKAKEEENNGNVSSSSSCLSSSAASESLKLMCLRADLWDAQKASERFLRHLHLLYDYYGEEALEQPLTLQRFFTQRFFSSQKNNANNSGSSNRNDGTAATTNKNAPPTRKKRKYKKKGGATAVGGVNSSITIPNEPPKKKKKGQETQLSTNTGALLTEHMSWLKQGGFQVLPSRDRSGRRVVIIHGVSNEEQQSKLNNNKFRNMFKAMLYFFTTIAKCDLDAQRDGIVLILSTSVSSSFDLTGSHMNDTTNDINNTSKSSASVSTLATSASSHASEFFEIFYEFYRSLPIRCNSVHICYDIKNDTQLSKIRLNMIQRLGPEFAQRVRVYDTDACHINTQKQLATYGIPVHDIPITESGTLKLKHHYRWIKIQDFLEKQERIAKETIAQKEDLAIALAAAAALQFAVTAVNQQRAQAVMSSYPSMDGLYYQQQLSQHQLFPVPSYYGYQQQQQQEVMPQVTPQPMLYTPISSLQSSFPLSPCATKNGQQKKQQQQPTQPKQKGSKKSNSKNNNKDTDDTTMNNNNENVEFALIECPRVNDVLFLRGGKFWNDNNKFQRGNLEFMEILCSKITVYQGTRSSKEKNEILKTVVNDFLALTNGKGRFLTDATAKLQNKVNNETTPPNGCWIELSLSSPLLMQKVRNALINRSRRLEKVSIVLPKCNNRCVKRADAEKKVNKKRTTAPRKKKIVVTPKKIVATTKIMMKPITTPITKLSLLPSLAKLPLSLSRPPQSCLHLSSTRKKPLFSIFNDIDIGDIPNNCTSDDNNYDIDGTNNGSDTKRSSNMDIVMNAIFAVDDSMNCEIDDFFMNSDGDQDNPIDHHYHDIGVGDGASLAGNLEDDFPILSIDANINNCQNEGFAELVGQGSHEEIDGITDSLLESLF